MKKSLSSDLDPGVPDTGGDEDQKREISSTFGIVYMARRSLYNYRTAVLFRQVFIP